MVYAVRPTMLNIILESMSSNSNESTKEQFNICFGYFMQWPCKKRNIRKLDSFTSNVTYD